jgi:hypothetical protein
MRVSGGLGQNAGLSRSGAELAGMWSYVGTAPRGFLGVGCWANGERPLDRLGRSLRDLITMLDYFRSKGIRFRSLTEAIDTETPTGRAM